MNQGHASRGATNVSAWGRSGEQDKGMISRLAGIFERISVLSLAFIAILIFIQIALRNLFSMAFAGIEELARFAHVTMVFLLVPILFREGKHVTIDIVLLHVPPKINKALRLVATLLTAAYGAFFLVSEYQFMHKNATVPTPGLGMPNILFFMGAYIGMALLLLTAIEQFIRLVRGKA